MQTCSMRASWTVQVRMKIARNLMGVDFFSFFPLSTTMDWEVFGDMFLLNTDWIVFSWKKLNVLMANGCSGLLWASWQRMFKHCSLRQWQWSMYFPQFLILLHLAPMWNAIICIMCFGRWYQVPLFSSNVGSFGLQVGKPAFSRSYKLCVWIHNMKAKFCRSLQVLKHSLHTIVEKRCSCLCHMLLPSMQVACDAAWFYLPNNLRNIVSSPYQLSFAALQIFMPLLHILENL